jgi:hypothetical protein
MGNIEWVQQLGLIVGVIGTAALGLSIAWHWGYRTGLKEGFRDGQRLKYVHPARPHRAGDVDNSPAGLR